MSPHAAWLARALGAVPSTQYHFVERYAGPDGRELFGWANQLLSLALEDPRRARTDAVQLADNTSVAELEDELP